MDSGDWNWGNGTTRAGVPAKVAAGWLVRNHPRDKDGYPIPFASHPTQFLIILIKVGDVKVFPIGTCNQYITISTAAYKELMKDTHVSKEEVNKDIVD